MSYAHEQEQVYIDEAITEALLTESQVLQGTSSEQHDGESKKTATVTVSGETSPLLSTTEELRRRQPYLRAANSFQSSLRDPGPDAGSLSALPWYKRPSIWWLMPAFLPFCVAFGGMIVPRSYLLLNLMCDRYLADKAMSSSTPYFHLRAGEESQRCRIPEVQKLVTYFNTYINVLSGGLAAVVSPFLGALSDRLGRKRIIACCSIGIFVTECLTIVCAKYPDKVSVYYLLIGYLIDGFCGSITAILALIQSYVADCTNIKNRAQSFGYLYGGLFLGIAAGPFVTAFIIKFTKDMLTPFYMALVCHGFFFLFMMLIVPESLSKEKQMKARENYRKHRAQLSQQSWKGALKKVNPFAPLWVLRPTGPGSSPALRRNLIILASIDFLMFGVLMGTMSIILIYPQYKFGWTVVDTSYYFATCNVVRVVCLLVILPLLNYLFRIRRPASAVTQKGADNADLYLMRAALLLDTIGYIGYALAPTGGFMYAAGITASIGGIGSPTIVASLSKHMPATLTGQLLGAASLLTALARVVGPVLFSLIYAQTLTVFPGLVFLCLSTLWIAAFILSWMLKTGVYYNDGSIVEPETPPGEPTESTHREIDRS